MKKIITIALLVALFFTIKASFAPETWNNFMDFMFADYARVWNAHYAPNLPSITHPIVLIIIALLVVALLRTKKKR